MTNNLVCRNRCTFFLGLLISFSSWGEQDLKTTGPVVPLVKTTLLNEPVVGVAFSPDGKKLLASTQNQFTGVWDFNGNQILKLKNVVGGG